ncbi:hypothetical protein glysoja_024601 [Glycine soja]|uniref:Uncharacterized protein n=1 Tax=Glycine soja TaxID=3848 RepID=A0A0B2PM98_GLYSO|nr:hypothetical protein glysoja_024601 [Glycine soja]
MIADAVSLKIKKEWQRITAPHPLTKYFRSKLNKVLQLKEDDALIVLNDDGLHIHYKF